MKKFLILLAITSFFSCGGLKDVSKLKEKDVVLSVHKGPCGGKCSVYNIDIYKTVMQYMRALPMLRSMGYMRSN
ncbi:MAG: hypothetical protein LC127_11895 [Chitinophagales bacterium]|nr:hypothetical protein [Chitinophagales bacterium]